MRPRRCVSPMLQVRRVEFQYSGSGASWRTFPHSVVRAPRLTPVPSAHTRFIQIGVEPLPDLSPHGHRRRVIGERRADEGIRPFAGVHPPRIAFHADRRAIAAARARLEDAAILAKPGERHRVTTPAAAGLDEAVAGRQPREWQPFERQSRSRLVDEAIAEREPVSAEIGADRCASTAERGDRHTAACAGRAPEGAAIAGRHGRGAVDPCRRDACRSEGCPSELLVPTLASSGS